jgi:DNA-binding NtrC family response regulator
MGGQTNFPVIPIEQVPVYSALGGPDGHCPMILVVDDEHMIADTLTIILSQRGYSAIAAYDAASAMELASRMPPDLLISDVAMPGMSGVDLAIFMVQHHPDCEILLFSGQASTVDLVASARAAGHVFTTLGKPLHPLAMLRKVAEKLERRSARESAARQN